MKKKLQSHSSGLKSTLVPLAYFFFTIIIVKNFVKQKTKMNGERKQFKKIFL